MQYRISCTFRAYFNLCDLHLVSLNLSWVLSSLCLISWAWTGAPSPSLVLFSCFWAFNINSWKRNLMDLYICTFTSVFNFYMDFFLKSNIVKYIFFTLVFAYLYLGKKRWKKEPKSYLYVWHQTWRGFNSWWFIFATRWSNCATSFTLFSNWTTFEQKQACFAGGRRRPFPMQLHN